MRISQAKELLFDAALESAYIFCSYQRGKPVPVNSQVQGQRTSFYNKAVLCPFLLKKLVSKKGNENDNFKAYTII